MSKNENSDDDREPGDYDDALQERAAREVYEQLLERVGEAAPQPRLAATRRAVELLGDPQRAYPIIHITGTNGKTSTSRLIESILRAHGLRTGMLTSPHLERVNERIVIDGEPISNTALVSNWRDITPFLELTDAELVAAGDPPLSYFEALTVLGFAAFADAPVDVVVLEVGMGGEWDSTNVADGQVAVFTPIALDHTARLGRTVAEIAKTKSGIIKPAAAIVTARQQPEALAELSRAAELTESTIAVEGDAFALVSDTVAVGGQVVTITGLAGTYSELFLPLFGDHQAQNAALAVAAVESFIGGGTVPLNPDVLAEGFATATSPGRLQVVGTEPTVLVDAAHNPHGAVALAQALGQYFTFDHTVAVLGVLADKDAQGILRALDGVVDEIVLTQSTSDRAVDADDLAAIAVPIFGPDRVIVEPSLEGALETARDIAGRTEKGGVVVAGSITLVGEAMSIATDQGWKQ
ncbi:bifunctional folylpolyglutamate synthase/dihydrofolate synthase [Galbitalea soli]|uniref:tetrahydrofolate synthase n=1 Tax=Galbitalea soli TaxID=1268042 RepID=A0A7C9PNJ5_9MICO|nr:folylpolyglutamate synthase/dihydrofolate synthase family protein [Galbitalea soli]NEM91714.1 bifunctional folylpolyglutamate synthase/dihydrofolate synthase [Galbitalea soli]NYJ30410.1 dihydrofolate synthase/folylpolyglutamate synthase [Galbitalea soli]